MKLEGWKVWLTPSKETSGTCSSTQSGECLYDSSKASNCSNPNQGSSILVLPIICHYPNKFDNACPRNPKYICSWWISSIPITGHAALKLPLSFLYLMSYMFPNQIFSPSTKITKTSIVKSTFLILNCVFQDRHTEKTIQSSTEGNGHHLKRLNVTWMGSIGCYYA